MKKKLDPFVCIALIAACCCTHLVADEPALSAEAHKALQSFLDEDCGTEVDSQVVQSMLAHADSVEPKLATWLRLGPDADRVTTAREALEAKWARRETFLATNPDLGLDSESMSLAQGLTREEFVNGGVERFAARYREKAAHALAAIGSESALETLNEAGHQGDASVRQLVREALVRFHPEQVASGGDGEPLRRSSSR